MFCTRTIQSETNAPKFKNYLVYSVPCCSRLVWLSFSCETQNKILNNAKEPQKDYILYANAMLIGIAFLIGENTIKEYIFGQIV